MDKLTLKLLTNKLPEITEDTLVYCFAHNESSLHMIIDSLKTYNITSCHIINNITAMSGVEDSMKVVDFYNKYDVSCKLIPFYQYMIHTRNESEAVIDYAKQYNYSKIICMAPNFHILRATMTMISVLIDKNMNLSCYCISGQTNNWEAKMITHQGKTIDTIDKIVEMEFERIKKYTDKKDIKSVDEILAYIK